MSEMPKDPVMLLSWLNMKLRDQYEDLADLCYDYHIPMQDVVDKMEAIGTITHTNQISSNKSVEPLLLFCLKFVLFRTKITR